jgi:hypothetical protein
MSQPQTSAGRSDEVLGKMVEALALSDAQKVYLHARWLGQVDWMSRTARQARDRYYALRLTTVVGGVIVPALVGLNLSGLASDAVHWATFGLSLVVAIAAALEEFFHYGERWRHYRRNVEWLTSHGCQFLQLCGPYQQFHSPAEAYPEFVNQVEKVLQEDPRTYFTDVVGERRQGESDASHAPAAR